MSQIPVQDLRSRFAALQNTSHPRLCAHSDSLPELGALEKYVAAIIKEADALVAVPTLTRVMEGRRLLAVSREALRRIQILAVAWMRSRKPEHLARAEAELLAVCAFEDWNTSHYLDTAEMMLGVALGYDLLYNALPAASREKIADGLWRLGLGTALCADAWWINARNNWGQVCHAGATAAALALAERHPNEAFAVIWRGFEKMRIPMGEYAPEGVYPEGPMYWDYGTSFNVAWFILVESALGTSFGADQAPGFIDTGDYMRHVTAPTGLYYNYADCFLRRRNFPALLWFADRFKDRFGGKESGVYGTEWRTLSEEPEKLLGNRVAPLICLFGLDRGTAPDPTPPPAPPASPALPLPLDFIGRGQSEIITLRSAWDDPAAWHVGIKAGTPLASHGHMDIGAFILEAKGERWACECGAEHYHNLEKIGYNLWDNSQDGQRWGVFRYGAASHNIIQINGERQHVNGFVPIEDFEINTPAPRAKLDLAPMYGRPVTREFVFKNRASLEITDTISGLPAGDTVRFQMLTTAHVSIRGAVLTLTQNNKTLTLSASLPEINWRCVEATELLHEWDTTEDIPGAGWRIILFERPAPVAGSELRHTVVIS